MCLFHISIRLATPQRYRGLRRAADHRLIPPAAILMKLFSWWRLVSFEETLQLMVSFEETFQCDWQMLLLEIR